MKARMLIVAGLLLPPLASGCDPCFGTSYCGEPAIDVTGFVRVHVEGAPAADLRVELRSVGGVGLVEDTVSTRTDSTGVFHFRAATEGEGTVIAELAFLPDPPCERYSYGLEVEIGTTEAEDGPAFLGGWGVGPVARVPPEEARTECPWESL